MRLSPKTVRSKQGSVTQMKILVKRRSSGNQRVRTSVIAVFSRYQLKITKSKL